MNPLEEAARKILAEKDIPADGSRPLTWTVSYELFEEYVKGENFKIPTKPGDLPRLLGYPVVMEFCAPDTFILTEVVGYGRVPAMASSGG